MLGSTPGNPVLKRNLRKMTDIVRQYNDLQHAGINHTQSPKLQQKDITKSLEPLSKKIPDELTEPLINLISTTEVLASIELLPNGVAAGSDGIPYELFKTLTACHAAAVKAKNPGFDIVNVLTEVFNDIETYGI